MRISRASLACLVVSGSLLVPGVAGLALATPAHAGPVVAAAPTGSTANQPSSWEQHFADQGAAGVNCYKIDGSSTPFVVPSAPDGRQWYAAIVKAGSGDDSNWVVQPLTTGTALSHPSGKDNSHVILCHVATSTTPPSSTPPSSTPPSSTPPSSTPPSSTPPSSTPPSSTPPSSTPPSSTPPSSSAPSTPATTTPADPTTPAPSGATTNRPGFGTGEDGGFGVWTLFLGGGLAAAAAAAWPKTVGRRQR